MKGKALLANDRLKLYLTMLQSAAQHAGSPAAPLADCGRKLAQVALHDVWWLQDMVKTAYFDDQTLILPHLGQLLDALAADLSIMARSLCDGSPKSDPELIARRDLWLQQLHAMAGDKGPIRRALAIL